MKISLRRRHALAVADGAFSHKKNYITILKEILNPEEHPNCITGSKVTAILLNGEFCPLVKLHREGSAPAACAAGLFQNCQDEAHTALNSLSISNPGKFKACIQTFFCFPLEVWKKNLPYLHFD